MIRLKRLFAHDFKQLREIELFFPDSGRILVQGKNEAGKSTLFEAIFFALFGQALATESVGRPNLDDLIGYEKNKSRVELDLAVRDRLFRITRTLNRGKPNVWELEITKGDHLEEIKGNRPVNDRLISELGFDAEALLNTCFVEQKKLEKLEGLNKSKREESLSKLLNLERLLDLEERLKLRGEDEKILLRLAKRVELAEAQGRLPVAEQDLYKTGHQLKLIELRAQVIHALDEKRAAAKLRDQLQKIQTRRDGLKAAVGTIDALDRGRRAMTTALDRFDLLAQQTAGLDALRHERDEAEHAARDHLPALERRTQDLRRLGRNLARLNRIKEARGVAANELLRQQALQQELSVNVERRSELESTVGQHETRSIQIENLLHDYDIGEALGAWATLAREAGAEAVGEKALEEMRLDRDRVAKRLRTVLIVASVITVALVAGTVLIPLAVLNVNHNYFLSIGAFGGLLLVDAVIALILLRHGRSVWIEVEGATAKLGKAQGEVEARRARVAAQAERLKSAETRLKELGATVPPSPESAQSRRVEIAATMGNKTQEELNAERDAERGRLNYTRAQRDEVLKHTEELEAAAAREDPARCRLIIEKAERTLNRWQPLFAARAADLKIEPDLQAIRDAWQDAESQRKAWQVRIQQAAILGAQIKEGEARAKKISDELRATYEMARTLLEDRGSPWSTELDRAAYVAFGRELAQAFESNGGEQARAQLNSLEKEMGACEGELKHRDKAGQEGVAMANAIQLELRMDDAISPRSSIEELIDLATRLQKMTLEDKPRLEALVKSLQMRVGALRDTRGRLERELGLQGELIDLEGATAELATESHQQEGRKFGAEIVLRARKRIVQKILPATMDYMRRILPQLTRDRYHDADLDPDSYKIKVWDERAGQNGAWKEKNIFSGGTKDQFSLALRLAFALATLPQERGTSPGFIFLDEPLGSFDDERAASLLYLLTEGEIARAFDQIFLISHLRVQEDRFTNLIRLENGVVVESNLESMN